MLAKKILAVFTAIVLMCVSTFTVMKVVASDEGVQVASNGDIASGGQIEEPTTEAPTTEEPTTEEPTTEEPTTEEPTTEEPTTEEPTTGEPTTEEPTTEEPTTEEPTTEEPTTEEPTTEEPTTEEPTTEEPSTEESSEAEEIVYVVEEVEIKAVDESGEAVEILEVQMSDLTAEPEQEQKAEKLKEEIKEIAAAEGLDEVAEGTVAAVLEIEVVTASGVEHDVKVTLTFKVAGIKSGDKVTVVHWPLDASGNTQTPEFITPDDVRNGEIDVTFTSLSPIAIVVEKAAEVETQGPTEAPTQEATQAPVQTPSTGTDTGTDAPDTGDNGYGMTLLVCLMAFGVGLAALGMKKKMAE